VVVAGSKRRVALGTLPLSGLVPRPEAVVAEAVETLSEHGVLSLHLARGTGQRLLVLPDLLLEDLVHVGGHLDLAQALDLSAHQHKLLVKALRFERLGLKGARLLGHRLLDLETNAIKTRTE
jgi:hypothetical protein